MTDAPPRTLTDRQRLAAVALLAGAFAAFGLLVSGPAAALRGMEAILRSRDTLITDYVALGGVGAAFLNAGALALIAVALFWRSGVAVSGRTVACLMLVLGFGLFGKNLLNVWPILGGVWLYARLRGAPFATHLTVAFFGCALAPVTSEIVFSTTMPPWASAPLGVCTGLVLGFILPPVAAQLYRAHNGYTLYNMGFAAGMIGTLVVAISITYGFVPQPVFLWATDQTMTLAPFILGCFAAMIVAGRVIDPDCFRRYRALVTGSGHGDGDFAATCGDGAMLVNMGVLGLAATGYVLAVGGDLNGPVIAAILSVVGFGGFGKHVLNCVPVVAGVFLATLLRQSDPAAPGILLAALFSTTLAPISGSFGWYWGMLAGAIHVSAAQSVGAFHGGLNLYNNGFAAGIVAAILAPVILSLTGRGPDAAQERL